MSHLISFSDLSKVMQAIKEKLALLDRRVGVDISRSEYDNLVSQGTLDPTVNYYIYEDDE